MGAARQIIDLRKLLAERFPHPAQTSKTLLSTGCDQLDQITGGGLPKSAITEVSSPARNVTQSGAGGPRASSGSASLIHRLIQEAEDDHHFVALIDGSDSFDPQSFRNQRFRHLFWVRCCKTFEAIKAADLLLRDGNFPIVILDLVLNAPAELRKIPQTSWYRLQRLVEATSSVCLVLTRQSIVSSAELKLVLENSWKLADLSNVRSALQLSFCVQRSHFNPEIRSQMSQVS